MFKEGLLQKRDLVGLLSTVSQGGDLLYLSRFPWRLLILVQLKSQLFTLFLCTAISGSSSKLCLSLVLLQIFSLMLTRSRIKTTC